MAMTQEEKIEIADMVRSRDRFGPVSEEELAALPGKETELWIRTKNGKTVHVFEERPENLPEQAALLLNFHGGGFLKGRTDATKFPPALCPARMIFSWSIPSSVLCSNA